jgi:hypothetical protein
MSKRRRRYYYLSLYVLNYILFINVIFNEI